MEQPFRSHPSTGHTCVLYCGPWKVTVEVFSDGSTRTWPPEPYGYGALLKTLQRDGFAPVSKVCQLLGTHRKGANDALEAAEEKLPPSIGLLQSQECSLYRRATRRYGGRPCRGLAAGPRLNEAVEAWFK